MKRELSDAFKDITAAVDAAPGFYKKVQARNAMERLRIAIEAGAFERTQREFLAEDLKALAEGKPVKTDLAKAVEVRIAKLEELIRKGERERDADDLLEKFRHVCGLSGYNPMIDDRCPGCEARHE